MSGFQNLFTICCEQTEGGPECAKCGAAVHEYGEHAFGNFGAKIGLRSRIMDRFSEGGRIAE